MKTGCGTDAYCYRLDTTREFSCKANASENCGHVASDCIAYKILQSLRASGLLILIRISGVDVLENACWIYRSNEFKQNLKQ